MVDAAQLGEFLERKFQALARRADVESPMDYLAAALEVDREQIYRWRKSLGPGRRPVTVHDRDDVEDALHKAGYFMWEVFEDDDADDVVDATTAGQRRSLERLIAGQPAGVYGKLTDSAMRELYEMHLEGVSARELGRRIWQQAGFKTPHSAMQAILARWEALGLPVHRPTSKRLTEEGRSERRRQRRDSGEVQAIVCSGRNKYGEPCSRWARPGSDRCTYHQRP
jgi:hypothetical protein